MSSNPSIIQVPSIDEIARSLKDIAPANAAITVGYIGNLERWGDNRSWSFFKSVAGEKCQRWPAHGCNSAADLQSLAWTRADLLAEWAMRASH